MVGESTAAGNFADHFPGIFHDLTKSKREGDAARRSSAVGTFARDGRRTHRFEFQIVGALVGRPPASVSDGAVPSSRSVDSQMRH